jgi:flagellin
LDGTATTTTYTALDANGNSIAQGGTPTFAAAASYAVTTTVTTPGSQNLLVQNGKDLTNFSITGGPQANSGLAAVNQAIAAVTNYAAQVGATQDRMTAATTFNTALQTNYANGVAGLVDADMNQASTRLQALQTQEQLGIQSLSVANQNAALILKLFG